MIVHRNVKNYQCSRNDLNGSSNSISYYEHSLDELNEGADKKKIFGYMYINVRNIDIRNNT